MADTTGLLDSATVAGYQKAIQGQTASQIAQEASSLGLSASQVAQVLGITAADVTAAGYTPTGGKVNADVANNTYVSPGKFQAASPTSTPATSTAVDLQRKVSQCLHRILSHWFNELLV